MVVALFAVLQHGRRLPAAGPRPPGRAARAHARRRGAAAAADDGGPRRRALPPADAALLLLDDPHVRAELDAEPSGPLADAEHPAFARDVPHRLEHLAYVIYTSGSTGRPKGVATAHRGLTNMQLNHRREIFDPVVADAGGRRLRIAHTVSFSFDMSWEELLWLVEGHELHVCDEHLRRDAEELVAYCDDHRIDVVNVTPTYAHHLIEQGLLDGPTPAGARAARRRGGARRPVVRACARPSARSATTSTGRPSTRSTRSARGTADSRHADRRRPDPQHPRLRARRVAAARAGRRAGRAVPRRRRPRARLQRELRPHRGALRRRPASGEPGARMYRTGDLVRLAPRRQPRLPRPHRRPGQDPRPPRRARRDRGRPRRAAGHRAGGRDRRRGRSRGDRAAGGVRRRRRTARPTPSACARSSRTACPTTWSRPR